MTTIFYIPINKRRGLRCFLKETCLHAAMVACDTDCCILIKILLFDPFHEIRYLPGRTRPYIRILVPVSIRAQLESAETSFMDKGNGGLLDENIIPELTQLAKENIRWAVFQCPLSSCQSKVSGNMCAFWENTLTAVRCPNIMNGIRERPSERCTMRLSMPQCSLSI